MGDLYYICVDELTKTCEPSHYSNCATVSLSFSNESRRLQVPSKWTLEAI